MTEPQFRRLPAQELGYLLYPPRRPTEPGYARLDVYLREQPSQHHFDPDAVNLHIAVHEGGTERLKIVHPWVGAGQWRVCAGQVDLLDRKGKHVDFFTFGGDLAVESSDNQLTHLSFTSEAPILLAHSITSSSALLIQEVEIQIAQLRAEWCHDAAHLDNCLACLSPFDLYRMCVVAVLERFDRMVMRDESVFKLNRILKDELAEIGSPSMNFNDLRV